MPRKRTGTVDWSRDDGRPQIILTFRGRRVRLEALPKGTSEAKARDQAAYWAELAAERERAGLELDGTAPKSAEAGAAPDGSAAADAWVLLWQRDREQRGLPYAREGASHYRHHLRATLGDKRVALWSGDDLRRLVVELDRKVRDGELSWKSAQNVWGTVTKMCKDACRSKVPALRVREDNPSAAVEGPDRGERTAKQFLYPDEMARFLAHPEVSLAWRRLVAIACYTFTRTGELRALLWDDVDLEHRVIHVHRSEELRTGRVKGTKTKHARRIPIEPALLPLLELMHQESGGVGFVVDVPRDVARPFRDLLARAGIDRAELHTATRTRKAMTFYDLRATGVTWAAVRGDEPLKIMQRAGHGDFDTTMIYVRMAEELGRDFGSPFAPLPPCLTSAPDAPIARIVRSNRSRVPQAHEIQRKRTGIEPARDSRTAPLRF